MRAPAQNGWHVAICLVLVLAMASVTLVFVRQSMAEQAVAAKAARFLLQPLLMGQSGASNTVPERTMERALLASPMRPATVNALIYSEAARGSVDQALSHINILARLGWRHTPALQNRALVAAQDMDLDKIVDIIDAMLRRNVLVANSTLIMNALEQDDQSRQIVVGRLAISPPWRSSYLQAVGGLRTAQQFAARADLIARLYRSGHGLDRQETYTNANHIVAAGAPAAAYPIWRAYSGAPASALNDPEFARAFEFRKNPIGPMPFEWLLHNGEGYSAEVEQEGGKSQLVVQWNGKGSPELVTQQTASARGRYRLHLSGEGLSARAIEDFNLLLRCRSGGTSYFGDAHSPRPGVLVLQADAPSRCDGAYFVIAGKPRDQPIGSGFGLGTQLSLALRSVRLERIGDDGGAI